MFISWVPLPGGNKAPLSLEPDLSVTVLLVVITINAVNFIDGLAAGIVAISALAYMTYSYELANSAGIPSQTRTLVGG